MPFALLRRLRPTRLLLALLALLVPASTAAAHAVVYPTTVESKAGSIFSLTVPTEKEDARTTGVELTIPSGLQVFSFEAAPGWRRAVQSTGEGESAVVQKVTWTGGSVPAGEMAVFRFTALPKSDATYAFRVRQTYSDGSVADWSGPEDADEPAPRVEAVADLTGGGDSSTLGIVALVVGGLGLLVGIAALAGARAARAHAEQPTGAGVGDPPRPRVEA